MEPRIINEMIEMLHKDDAMQEKTYTICFDSKKLKSGVDGQKKGDVNLWGHEQPPTLTDRKRKLEHDQ